MTQQPPGEADKAKPRRRKAKTTAASKAENTPLTGEDKQGEAKGPQSDGQDRSRNARRLLQRLTLSEWLTLLVGVGTLAVSILAWRTAADTSDLKDAVRGLAALAGQTKRQADATNAELEIFRRQAESTAAMVTPAQRSADAAVRQLQLQQDAFVATERPRITLAPVAKPIPPGPYQSNGRIWWAYALINTGKTPAVDLYNVQYMRLDDNSFVLDRPFGGADDVDYLRLDHAESYPALRPSNTSSATSRAQHSPCRLRL